MAGTAMTETPAAFVAAREQFLTLVAGVRPELHRYCARLTGSVIDGEDIVQDTLAKAFYALSQSPDVPALRPWLFRIAHNTALDFLKSHGRRLTAPAAELDDVAGWDAQPEPAVVRAALAHFLSLPVTQRSAVILKDVLGHSLDETAETMATTVLAVKAALVRGRRSLMDLARQAREDEVLQADTRAVLDRYARLFNARDWDGLRALISDDCRLDLVSKSQRRGKQVGVYFTNYEKQNVRMHLARLEGRWALAAFVEPADRPEDAPPSRRPDYFVLLQVQGDTITAIRDYRYVAYIASEADFELTAPLARTTDW